MEEAAVGREVSRVEGREKVTGQVSYAADFPMPGLLYAALVQAEVPNGWIKEESLRSSADRAMRAPGILKVLSPLNCPPLKVLPRELTYDLPLERRPPLSDLSVQHVGQHVALVVADTPENASLPFRSSSLNTRRSRHFSTHRPFSCTPLCPMKKTARFATGAIFRITS